MALFGKNDLHISRHEKKKRGWKYVAHEIYKAKHFTLLTDFPFYKGKPTKNKTWYFMSDIFNYTIILKGIWHYLSAFAL